LQVFTAEPLITGSQYLFRVAAENSVGVGEFTELTASVTAKSSHGKCTIVWQTSGIVLAQSTTL
jgi:hypothetical protein